MTETAVSRPYGEWDSPLTAEDLAGELRFSGVGFSGDGRRVVWREERSDRGHLVVAEPGRQAAATDLPTPESVQARVGYGGGDFTVGGDSVCYVCEGRLYRQRLDGPARLAAEVEGRLAAPALAPRRDSILAVRSDGETDCLMKIGSGAETFAAGHDFYMQPVWHPDGKRAAFVAWNHPNMPWDGSGLYLCGPDGSPRLAAGDPEGREALFQPEFSPDGRYLSYVSDRGGWFNLRLLDLESGRHRTLVGEGADHGLPAWVQGMRTQAWTFDSRAVCFLRSSRGFTTLWRIEIGAGRPEQIGGEIASYTALKQIAASPCEDRVALVASSPTRPPCIVTVTRQGRVSVVRCAAESSPHCSFLSRPRALTFPTSDGSTCHGLYYAPAHPRFTAEGPPPLILKVHGGPTSQYSADYHADTQFFASRGFAVLELNYRGSSGYGRAYADSLKGRWGVSDVEDAHAGARHAVEQGLADARRLVLMGGSAGGLTVLLSLIVHPGFYRAAVCRYAVCDLAPLAETTHKFERHYLDGLLGPDREAAFCDRSPLRHADRISDAVALFQGGRDPVVPRAQSDRMARSLAQRGVPHLYRVYPEEGHGWRRRETMLDYYRSVLAFIREQAP